MFYTVDAVGTKEVTKLPLNLRRIGSAPAAAFAVLPVLEQWFVGC